MKTMKLPTVRNVSGNLFNPIKLNSKLYNPSVLSRLNYGLQCQRFYSEGGNNTNNIKNNNNENKASIGTRKPLSRVSIGKKSPAELAARAKIGIFNWKAAVLFLITGVGLVIFFRKEKKRLELQKEEKANRGIGKPLIGGPFSLIDQDGNPFTEKNLLGKFSLVYFGFTMCPDICPEELDKIVYVVDKLKKSGYDVQPIFVTCDPARDTPDIMKAYLEDFDESIIGLTGSYESIKSMCKVYRVYFSTPPNVKKGQDYLVDHSIFIYLMDPEGQFVDALGRQYDKNTAIDRVKQHMDQWKKDHSESKGWFS